jgi:hypothetical protein
MFESSLDAQQIQMKLARTWKLMRKYSTVVGISSICQAREPSRYFLELGGTALIESAVLKIFTPY